MNVGTISAAIGLAILALFVHIGIKRGFVK